jgi:hypothetical protein
LEKEVEVDPKGYSASTAYLSQCHSLMCVPQPIGLISFEGRDDEISAK